MLDPMENLNVFIDPSLLVDERTLSKVVEYLEQNTLDSKKEQFFVSSKFVELLTDAERNMRDILFFSNAARMVDLKELKSILEKIKISRFGVSPHYREEYITLYETLLAETKSKEIAEILLEEWAFLQKKSWVISRLKKPFSYLVKSGAVSIEIGKKALDYAVRKSLKKGSQNIITKADRMRALAKWIAVGGAATSNLLDPISNMIGEFIAGIFLLIDPEQ